MSCFDRRAGEAMIGSCSPRGVAPERMPKAEATGLAPLLIGNSRTLERRCSGVFDFDLATSGWWSFGAEALGLIKARDRRAGFARRSICLGLRRQCLAA